MGLWRPVVHPLVMKQAQAGDSKVNQTVDLLVRQLDLFICKPVVKLRQET